MPVYVILDQRMRLGRLGFLIGLGGGGGVVQVMPWARLCVFTHWMYGEEGMVCLFVCMRIY